MKTINLSDNKLILLRNILASHQDLLEQNQAGEPWQPEELQLTKALIEAARLAILTENRDAERDEEQEKFLAVHLRDNKAGLSK